MRALQVRCSDGWLANRGPDAPPVVCFINLSGRSLGDPTFLDFVLETFDNTRAPGEQVCFEVTETAAIGNLSRAVSFINAVRSAGLRDGPGRFRHRLRAGLRERPPGAAHGGASRTGR